MPSVSFVDILQFLKKRLVTIIAFTILGAFIGALLCMYMQTYTATVGISYNYSGAAEELNPLGEPLDVYEIMQPALINEALEEMGSKLSVEEVRNQLSVSPVIKTTDAEVHEARLKLGEASEVTTTNYQVSYTCPGKLGGEFAQHFLYQLLRKYDDQFSHRYLSMNRIPDFMSLVDVESMDYTEMCNYIDKQLTEIITKLDSLVNENGEYVSCKTGLDFAALRAFYVMLRDVQFAQFNANVRNDLLTKNRDLLIHGYEKMLEDLRLSRQNSEDESSEAHEYVLSFYEQYKKNNLYYQARTTQLETDNANSDNKNLVYDYDLSLVINTYDDILLRYVNTGVAATNYAHDIDYYENLISKYRNDHTSESQKKILIERAEQLLEGITEVSASYAALANETLEDYYYSKIASSIAYMMAVEVSPGISMTLAVAVGMFLMCMLGIAYAIVYESVRVAMERQKLEALKFSEEGVLSAELVEQMTPKERAFYEQSLNGFDEFYLMYQPMVHEGRWEMSETLVRWSSKSFGQVLPDEFLAIAEKYKLLDALGAWILREVCAQSLEWQKSGAASPVISMNCSAQQIESQSFVDMICSVIAESGADASNVYLEISGGGELRNIDTLAKKFAALKALGLGVTIDRFGGTISSLRVVYELPADMLKLDKRMLECLHNPESKDSAFLKQIVSVCQEQGLVLCVCGVEEAWQVEELLKMGIYYTQGFYFSSPLRAKEYEQRYALSSAAVKAKDAETPGDSEHGNQAPGGTAALCEGVSV